MRNSGEGWQSVTGHDLFHHRDGNERKGISILRIWFREWKDSRMIRDMVVTDDSEDTRTHKIFHAIDEVCRAFDLAHPIWLDSNIRDFKRGAKCRFTPDSFQDEVPFDYLEIQVLEED